MTTHGAPNLSLFKVADFFLPVAREREHSAAQGPRKALQILVSRFHHANSLRRLPRGFLEACVSLEQGMIPTATLQRAGHENSEPFGPDA